MHLDMVVGLLLIFFVIVVPVLGITVRFALKPMVESLLTLRDAFGHGPAVGARDGRILELEEEVAELRRSVKALQEARSWDDSLLAPPRRERQ
ncbi:MAG: hypothetical protein EA422_06400 [Gemmatimonadales bacterium]|nr:MAG: hypothetical protein EA422_06400 [Gemmatimonadales bacterium]